MYDVQSQSQSQSRCQSESERRVPRPAIIIKSTPTGIESFQIAITQYIAAAGSR